MVLGLFAALMAAGALAAGSVSATPGVYHDMFNQAIGKVADSATTPNPTSDVYHDM
jgi:hypothetical protein